MTTTQFLQQIRDLIAHDDLTSALQQLRLLLANSPKLDEALLQSARFQDIRQQIRLGLVSHAEANLTQNQIRAGLLDLLREIEQMASEEVTLSHPFTTKDISDEIAHAISIVHSKNVVIGSTITGKNIHIGDIIQYGDQKIPRVLTKPPFRSEVFLGREEDIKAIRQQLFSGDNLLLLVNGQGGVGKTSIAAHYYDRFQAEYAHTAWVLRERSIANTLLLNLATPLGLSFAADAPEAERLDTLLLAMANLDKPCLLIIDNANEVDDLERNYLHLRRCGNFHLLLTSRITHFEQAGRHAIEGLPEAQALKLFKRYYPKFQTEEEPIFQQIHTAVGGNTLVIEVLAKNLALFHGIRQQYSLAQMLADLQTKGLLALSKSQAVKVGYQAKDVLRSETPEDIIAAMYDLGDLERAERALLSVFAVLPAESIGFETLESLLPGLADLEENALRLAQRGWIDYDEPGASFKCNPVIQEITRKKNALLREDCATLLDSLIDKLDREVIHLDNYQQAALCVRYGESILNALTIPDNSLDALCDRMGYYYQQVGNLDKALSIYERKRGLVEKLLEAAPQNEELKNSLATTLGWLGETHSSLGNLDQALQYYEERSRLSKELFEAYPNNVEFKNGLAISYEKLGSTHTSLGNLDQALQYYEERSRLGKELFAAYPNNVSFKNGLAISYSKLGNTHTSLGNLDQALQYYEDDLKLTQELFEAYPNNVAFKNGLAISYEKLGKTHTSLGNLDKALQYYEDETNLFKELFEAYPNNVAFKNGLAISYAKLGETHTSLGNLDQALQYYEDETTLFKELFEAYPNNVEFKNGLAISYEKLGETHSSLGNLDQALQYYEDYLKLTKELFAAYPNNVSFKNGLAISYSKLGSTHTSLGNLDQALQYYEDFLKLTKELFEAYPNNVEFKLNLGWANQFLGITHSSLGNLDKALTFYEIMNRLFDELYATYPQNVSFKNGLAISYYKLGAFSRDQLQDNARAKAYFQEAEKLWVELVRDAPQYSDFQRFLKILQKEMADLKK